VGLVSGVGLAVKGHVVRCIDQRPEVVERLERGEVPIYEPGLEELLAQVRASGHFSAGSDLAAAVADSDVAIIAVGTPSRDGEIDLDQIRGAAAAVGRVLRESDRFHTVVVKSTVVPGTTDTVVREILEAESGKSLGQFGLAANPEFLREGCAVSDFLEPDRIVIGAEDEGARAALETLYAVFDAEKVFVTSRTAEFIKYANNALLALQISATNDLANLASAIGDVDIEQVMNGVHLDHRWSPIGSDGERVRPGILSYLKAGCGFGGSCFPKDVEALVALGRRAGRPLRVFEEALELNRSQPLRVVEALEAELGGVQGRRIAVLGMAFKPDTDDIRESPGIRIARELIDRGAQVAAVDPIAHVHAAEALGIPVESEWRRAVAGADAVAFITAWHDYTQIDAEELRGLMRGDVVVDGRRMLDADAFSRDLRLRRIGYEPGRKSQERERAGQA
jgi:UDPglucose 6-dehydrogenase/GDP-mannose 6-dehydrogenase